jgi:hypothetical protein
MKGIFTLLVLTIGLKSYSQVALLRGQIKDSTENGFIKGAELKFLKNDTTIISGFNGTYRIELKKSLTDTIVVTHWVYGSRRVPISLTDKMVKELDIQFPIACKTFPKTGRCPKCKANKNVIDIVYGYPTEKLLQLANKGKVILGGCVIDDCAPYHYCKKDNLEF